MGPQWKEAKITNENLLGEPKKWEDTTKKRFLRGGGVCEPSPHHGLLGIKGIQGRVHGSAVVAWQILPLETTKSLSR